MNFTNNPPNQIQFSTCRSLLISLLSIIFLLCQHCLATTNLYNQTDRFALLEFKHQIADDPHNFFDSWNDSLHFCEWRGVTCGLRHKRVISLDISGQNILGTISPHIGNLSFLRFINLNHNSFHGKIPQQIGQLFRLRTLILSNNNLHGQLPTNLTCVHLEKLFLNKNWLVGAIPVELGSLMMLDTLNLGSNNFSGFIPRFFGNFSSLTRISLVENNFKGTIPNELGQLTKLTFITLGFNNLSGAIPSSLFNISTLTKFGTTKNEFTGILPPNIGLTSPNLKVLTFGGNKIHGEIPSSLSNASQLQILEISENKLTGEVPANLGYLQNLQKLQAWGNSFGSKSTNDLSFITSLSNCSNLQKLNLDDNNFGGKIPGSVGNLSVQLKVLVLADNYIAGTIPSVLENLVNLYGLGLENNLLVGSIPSSLGKLRNLQVLQLYGNKLSGQIPSSVGNITELYLLNLSGNKLQGNIPENIGNCKRLGVLDLSKNSLSGSIPKTVVSIFSLSVFLDLSRNSLIGSLPVEVGTLKNINGIDVSNNELTGKIPATIGECSRLEYLFIQGNFFQGSIPSSLVALKGIRALDLSRNNLSSQIPKGMEKLPYLQFLNLSFNKLEGEVPMHGVFGNASAVFINGNSKLCGGIKELQLQSCQITTKKPRVPLPWKIVIIACAGVLVLVLVSIISIIFRRRKVRNAPASADSIVEKILRISYHELYQATEGFSSRNLIGSGSFGCVYQGKLNQEDKVVAVKVLNLEKTGASKSFITECKALKNIRHRNLVKIKTYCSSIDSKGNPFKALVYNFMSNGSLDMWLHPYVQERSASFGLLQRVNIAIDVANAIHYLHDLCEPPIIHCDLKPSNILLDDELIAHVGDFGLARLLSKSVDTFAASHSSSMGIKGSIGYSAPEYGMGGEATKYGDIYSYGVLLLEMMTGRRPTDAMFKDGLSLYNYARAALEQENVLMIVDSALVKTRVAENGATAAEEESEYGDEIVVEQNNGSMENVHSEHSKLEKCIFGVVEIGVRCSAESPKERMGMNEVLRELHHIRTAFLGN